MLPNMSRVLPQQLKHVSFKDDSRYQPIKVCVFAFDLNVQAISGGIILVQDKKKGEIEEFIDFSTPVATMEATTEEEAPPPEPFEYPFDD